MTETTPAYKVIEEHMSEAELQSLVIEIAHLYSWKVAHFRACRTEKGWRTPVEADGKGFVDLVMVRPLERARYIGDLGRVIFMELKREGGRVTEEQREWHRVLIEAGAEAYICEPHDLDWMREVLLP